MFLPVMCNYREAQQSSWGTQSLKVPLENLAELSVGVLSWNLDSSSLESRGRCLSHSFPELLQQFANGLEHHTLVMHAKITWYSATGRGTGKWQENIICYSSWKNDFFPRHCSYHRNKPSTSRQFRIESIIWKEDTQNLKGVQSYWTQPGRKMK